MNRILLSALFSLLLITAPAVSKAKTILVYGEGHSFTLDEPEGWVMDYKSGAQSGFPVVSYPKNSTWQDAKSVIYIKILDKKVDESDKLSELIEEDLRNLKDYKPATKMTKGDAMLTKDFRDAIIRKYTDGDKINHATAYIIHPKLVIMATLSAHDTENFDENYSIFQEVVESYNFKTSRVDSNTIERLQKETYPEQKQQDSLEGTDDIIPNGASSSPTL